MSNLGVTIAGQPLDHMVYHFVLELGSGIALLLREFREPE